MVDNYEMLFDPKIIAKYQEENPTAKVTDIVYNYLESAILSSKISPGSKINAANIAEALNVSVTPVRNAIRQLAAVGLLSENENGKNYYAFNISEKMLTEVFDARRMLEGSASYICAQRIALIDMRELRHLADIYRTLWQEFADGDYSLLNRRRRIDIDRAFHNLLIRSTENHYLIDYYSSLEKMATHALIRALEFWDNEKDRSNMLILAAQHHIICNGVESGVPEVARKAAESHVEFATLRCVVNRKRG
ncbi:GntR family transcriptional regulator [uncultured Dysosmobacter sp.]|uniref:GntR family transcriptional regulator n=1 Tax=uncultured Dysosmobacter sp. TaxID=2591384 RepID=UPI00263313A3|nr:GntR family transcriptional regulator [uncultured Dysosmobacter sp.]